MFHFPNDLEVNSREISIIFISPRQTLCGRSKRCIRIIQADIEQWADPGEYTEEQLEQNLILDSNLFTIVPKSGNLRPGESQQIIMTYSHEFAGLHRLPVVFKIQNGVTPIGREMLLCFQGYSVPPGKSCLYFHSTRHEFSPVEIGLANPPVQVSLLNTTRAPAIGDKDIGHCRIEDFVVIQVLQGVQHVSCNDLF